MCGIVGCFSNKRRVERHLVKKGLDRLHHRGPDGHDLWVARDGKGAIGHTRLAVVGGDEGVQPIVNEDRTVALAVNGELYGFRSIRRRLEAAGHCFRTDSDSEIALHLYEEHGLDFVDHLRGEFAIVLIDGRRNRLVAVRDRFGIKPLCYARAGGQLLLASEAKALFAMGVPARWDRGSLMHAISHQYLPMSRTLFEGVSQIPPAHLLVDDGIGESVRPYWVPQFAEEPDLGTDGEVVAGEVLAAVEEAVALRVAEPEPAAFSLSGGLDSSAVVALAQKELGRRVPCFSVQFEGAGYDELGLVNDGADEIGAEVTPVPVSRLQQVEHLSEAAAGTEGIAINGQLVGKFLLNKEVRAAGFKVVLSGEGADEAFLGYSHLHLDHLRLASPESLPEVEAQLGVQRGVMTPGLDGAPPVPFQPPPWLGQTPSFLSTKRAFVDHYLPLVGDEEAAQLKRGGFVESAVDEIFDAGGMAVPCSFANRSSWLWTRTALGNYILKTLGDGAEMLHSVQGRVPFLDHKLFELAAKLPTCSKLKGVTAKAVLREALRPVLPATICSRVKHPFLAPPLLAEPEDSAADSVMDLLRSSELGDIPIFEAPKVRAWGERLRKDSRERRAAADPALTTILSCAAIGAAYRLT